MTTPRKQPPVLGDYEHIAEADDDSLVLLAGIANLTDPPPDPLVLRVALQALMEGKAIAAALEGRSPLKGVKRTPETDVVRDRLGDWMRWARTVLGGKSATEL
jgi:hypothetical protein